MWNHERLDPRIRVSDAVMREFEVIERPRDSVLIGPASSAQRSQWLLERSRPGSRAYLLPVLLPLPCGTTWRSLAGSLSTVVGAHPSLRRGLWSPDDSIERLEVFEVASPRMVVPEMRSVEALDQTSVTRIIEGLGEAIPSVGTGRPWRAFGLATSKGLEGLLWLIHHVAVDAPSLEVLVDDLRKAWRGEEIPPGTRDHPRPPSEPRLGPEKLESAIATFKSAMKDAPVGLPNRRVPTSIRGGRRLVQELGPEALVRLDDRIRMGSGSRTAAVLASVRRAAPILGASERGPFPIGVPFSLRDTPGLERTVGMFLNTLPVAVDADWGMDRVMEALWSARRLRHLPYEVAAKGSPRIHPERAPWLDITVGVVEHASEDPHRFVHEVMHAGDAPFPVSLVVRFTSTGIRLELDIDLRWTDHDDAQRFLDRIAIELAGGSLVGDLGHASSTTASTAGSSAVDRPEKAIVVDPAAVLEALEGPADRSRVPEDRSLAVLGIDSLDAVRLQRQIERRWSRRLPIIEILSSDLTSLRTSLGVTPTSTIPSRVPGAGSAPADESGWRVMPAAVRELLLAEAFGAPGMLNLAWRVSLPTVERGDLERRLRRVVDRHESLRCRLDLQRGLHIGPGPTDEFAIDWRVSPPDDATRTRFVRTPFDLRHETPIRLLGWQEDAGRQELLVVVHHAVLGGREAMQVLREIAEDRDSGATRRFVAADTAEADTTWWSDRVRSSLGGTPVPPEDGRKPATEIAASSDASASHLRARQAASERSLSGVAPSVAAWGILLARAMGRTKVVLGVPFTVDAADGTAELPTAFPVVVDASPDRTVLSVVEEIGETIAAGMEHRRTTLGSIGRRLCDPAETGRSLGDWLDGVVTFHDTSSCFGDWQVRWTPAESDRFAASLVLPENPGGGDAVLAVSSKVSSGESAESMLVRFATTLDDIREIVGTGRSDRVAELETLSPDQRSIIDLDASGPSSTDARDLVAVFLDVANARDGSLAVIGADRTLTYGELERWSRRVAAAIRSAIEEPEQARIAIQGQRCPETIAGMLGILRAGAAYVPIDPAVPPASVAELVTIAGVTAVLERTDGATLSPIAVPGPRVRMPEFDAIDPGPPLPVLSSQSDRPAYVMFTSGSTGRPRGVVVPHRAVRRLADDPWFLPIEPGFRMLHAAPPAFDASTLEIWLPLLVGGTVCCWEGSEADLVGMAARIDRDRIRGCWLTSALFNLAVDTHPEFFTSLDVVLTGGEVVSPDHVERLFQFRPDLAVINGYGPTENTVFTCCESVVPGGLVPGRPIPIGRPVPGTSVRILGSDGIAVPPGRFGELATSGIGVALGYLQGSRGPVISGGFRIEDTGPTYATGDLARWLPDGRLDYGGRIDSQIKIGGHRVEPSGIEEAIRRCEGVIDASVVVIDHAGRRRLGAVVVPETIDLEAVEAALARRLPPWELPAKLVAVEQLPRTRNGKPDRRAALRMLESSMEQRAPIAEDAAETEELLGSVLAAMRRVQPLMKVDQAIGGALDSLDLLRISIELEDVLARPIPLDILLDAPTPRTIAARLAREIGREASPIVELTPGALASFRGVYCIPGVGGTVFSFSGLRDRLPSEMPLLGLPYPGTADDREPSTSVADLADRLLSQMEGGPIPSMIVGYSIGGFVGLEIARRLWDRGTRLSLVVIDGSIVDLPSRTRRLTRLRLVDVLPAAMVDRLRRHRRSDTPARLRRVISAGFEAYRTYSPSPVPVDVVLVRTSDGRPEPVDYGWSEVAGQVEVRRVSGSHLEVFQRGASELSSILEDVWRRGAPLEDGGARAG